MVSEDIREKLSMGVVINAPGVLKHLDELGYTTRDTLQGGEACKAKALYISSTHMTVESLVAAHHDGDANFLLPQDILDIPIPEPEEPIITEWDYQVGDVVELLEDRSYGLKGSQFTVNMVDNSSTRQPIRIAGIQWPCIGNFKLVKKAERKVTVEMSKDTYESLKDSLQDAKVI